MNRKTITGAAAAVFIAATAAIVTMDPLPANLVSREPEPPVFVPLTVWVCCSVNGCGEALGCEVVSASERQVEGDGELRVRHR